MIKYQTHNITLSEIPKEISLTFEITNCPRKCKNCHTPELQQDIGTELTLSELKRIISQNTVNNRHLFSCVLFLGGEQHTELLSLVKYITSIGLKCALYTGADDVSKELSDNLCYLKTGPYIEALGGLDSPTTNQKFMEMC